MEQLGQMERACSTVLPRRTRERNAKRVSASSIFIIVQDIFERLQLAVSRFVFRDLSHWIARSNCRFFGKRQPLIGIHYYGKYPYHHYAKPSSLCVQFHGQWAGTAGGCLEREVYDNRLVECEERATVITGDNTDGDSLKPVLFDVVSFCFNLFLKFFWSQDDFDFNEVFAEYFSHEFDLDPLNAYTSSMANYNTAPTATVQGLPTAAQAHAAALAQTSNAVVEPTTVAADATTTVDATAAGGSSVVPNPTTTTAPTTTSKGFHLPTGGIKTAFHVGSSVPSRPAGVIVPPTKRTKSETAASSANTMPPPTTVPSATTAPTPIAALALAHQQAASAAAVQQLQEQQQQQQQLLNQQQTQQQLAVLQQFGMQAQQLQQQQQQQLNLATAVPTTVTSSTTATTAAAAGVGPATAAANKAAAATANRVALPVGVGIRLGGLGGIAPATAAATARPPMIQAQFAAALWGGAAAAAAGGAPALLPGANEQAAAERRQRNREHAKRSRVRKKFMLESMQEQVRSLQIENQNLRMIVQEHIPEHAVSIISECCTTSPLFAEPEEEKAGTAGDAIALGKSDFSLMESLTSGQRCFVLSDPKLPDNPIVFASPGFYEMTGYTAKEVLGRNCRFLQGPGTDPRAVDVIRKAIATGADATICLLNYKADGTPFWNQFFIAALRDSDNCIVNYVSVKERTMLRVILGP